jgi:hypothetical protein
MTSKPTASEYDIDENPWIPQGEPVNINANDKDTFSLLKLASFLLGSFITVMMWSIPIGAVCIGFHWIECGKLFGGC